MKVVVTGDSEHAVTWRGMDGDDVVIQHAGAPAPDLSGAACCIIRADAAEPAIRAARAVAAADASLQLVIAAPEHIHAALQRAILFAGGIGEVWIRTPAALDRAVLEEAAAVTAQRRHFRATQRRLEHDLSAIEPHSARRAIISDAYLAALLAVLPDPVISVGEDQQVISWNDAAERIFGVPRGRAIGRPLHELVRPADGSDLQSLLEHQGETPQRRDMMLQRAHDEPLAADVVTVTVEAEGRRVRVLLVHDVTERRRQQQELEANALELELQAEELQHQRSEAEAANRAKSDFLATMSHEIRTPINAIMGYTDLLQLGIAGPLTPQQAEHLDRVNMSSRHLLRLIEDVLDLAKVEAGRVSVQQEHGVVVYAVATAVELVAPQAEAESIRLSSRSVDEGDTTYLGDEHRVRQILVNLLTNAVKFTDPGGEIEVTYGSTPRSDAPAEGDWSWITVRDTGTGIGPHDRERIFRAFEQVESGRTRRHGGAGLGLAISRELARLMGGDITLESEPGAGSEFTLWLPRTVAAAMPRRADDRAAVAVELRDVGTCVLRDLDVLSDTIVKRMRSELPEAAHVDDVRLRDHLPTWVTELGQVLVDLGTEADQPRQLRDGVEIRRLIAELHGRQRAALAWSTDSLRREMQILREEIDRVVHIRAGDGDASRLAADVMQRLIEEATATALRTFDAATG